MSPKLAIALVLAVMATGCEDTRPPGGDAGFSTRVDARSVGGRCEGYQTPCSLISDSLDCVLALGCRSDDECTGLAQSCYSQFSSFSCTDQDGCYWSSSDNCSGSARSCRSMYSGYSCRSQDGCRWREGCSGTAWQCSLHDGQRYDCENQAGCLWVE